MMKRGSYCRFCPNFSLLDASNDCDDDVYDDLHDMNEVLFPKTESINNKCLIK